MSVKASEELRRVVELDPATDVVSSKVKWGGSWRCPADGEPMIEADGVVRCTSCERVLPGGLIYQLIEFNDHPR